MTDDGRDGGLSSPEGREHEKPRQKRSSRVEIDGWINLDKPTGVSSTQAVGRLKFLFNAKKAGHAGTLVAECRHRHLPPAVELAQERRSGDDHVVEEELGEDAVARHRA